MIFALLAVVAFMVFALFCLLKSAQREDRRMEAEEPREWEWPIATTHGRKLERDDG